jgi:hypothetical protein
MSPALLVSLGILISFCAFAPLAYWDDKRRRAQGRPAGRPAKAGASAPALPPNLRPWLWALVLAPGAPLALLQAWGPLILWLGGACAAGWVLVLGLGLGRPAPPSG